MKFQLNWIGVSFTVALGILSGLSLFTFNYAEGTSYFSDDPQSCVNCHVMQEQFEGWNRGSHKAVATCNDCHSPHTFPGKYIVKGLNGWNHSLAFTTGNFPNTIRIKDFNVAVAQNSCVDCHEGMVSHVVGDANKEPLTCMACHQDVGH